MALQVTTEGTPTGWAADARYQNYLAAQQIAGKPHTPYSGNMLAPWNQGQAQGYNGILNGGGIGQGAQAQGQHAALSAAQAGAQQVQGRGYAPVNQGVMNTPWASAGNAHLGQAFNTAAASAGPAARMQAAQGDLAQMRAAQMDRGSVRDVTAKNFLNYDVNKYMNPYINTVVNNSLKDLSRQNDIVNNQTNARAAAAGAFGGSRQAVANTLNNENFIRESGNLSGKLRHQGYDTASGLIMQDANRDLTAQQSNQQMDYNVGSLNTNNSQQAGMQNMLAANNMSQYNAGNRQAASQWNAGAQNSMSQYNASNQQQAYRDTAAAHNARESANADAINRRAEYNTGNQQRGYELTSQAHNTALANQANAANRAAEFGADSDLRAQAFNQAAWQNNINSRITAGNALNGMGMDEQTRAFTALDAQYRMGQNRTDFDQLALNDQYRRYAEAQDYPRNQLNYLQNMLGNYNTGTSSTTPYHNNTAANVAAGVGGGIQMAGQLPQAINGLRSGYQFLNGMLPSGASSLPSTIADTGAMSADDLLTDWYSSAGGGGGDWWDPRNWF